ncbi:MAG: hypothetical protein IT447_07260 [Phycisphaerales bacterium]|nr:hypothetical protein [Phycisphaerales bacterium]
MSKQLNDGDRTAVDILLDQHASSQDGGIATASAATPSFRHRLQAIEKTLSLLDSWQPADPPADLTLRTLRRIHDAESLHSGSARSNHANAQQPRPVI